MVIGFQKQLIETISQLANAKEVVPTLYFGTAIEAYFKVNTYIKLLLHKMFKPINILF